MGGPAWERCQANSNRREILDEPPTAREPRSNPAAVSLPRRHRRQRAAVAAPGADIGAATARRRDRDRSRTGRRPHRRDHRRRNRTPPRHLVLPRRRVCPGGRLLSRRPGLADRGADPRHGHLGRLPARPRAPVSGRRRRRPGRLPGPPANGTDPADVAFAGESAGGGLAVATLVNARDHGLPLPAAAYVMSPYADLTLAGTTMDIKRAADPLLSRDNLQARVPD